MRRLRDKAPLFLLLLLRTAFFLFVVLLLLLWRTVILLLADGQTVGVAVQRRDVEAAVNAGRLETWADKRTLWRSYFKTRVLPPLNFHPKEVNRRWWRNEGVAIRKWLLCLPQNPAVYSKPYDDHVSNFYLKKKKLNFNLKKIQNDCWVWTDGGVELLLNKIKQHVYLQSVETPALVPFCCDYSSCFEEDGVKTQRSGIWKATFPSEAAF